MDRPLPWRLVAAGALIVTSVAATTLVIVRYQGLTSLARSESELTYAYLLQKELEDVIAVFRGAEFHQRNFLLTGMPAAKAAFEQYVQRLPSTIEEVRQLLAKDAARRAELDHIEARLNSRVAVLKDEVQAQAMASSWMTSAVRDADVIGPIEVMTEEAVDGMDLRRQQLIDNVSSSFVTGIITAVASLAAIGAVLIWLSLDLRRRVRVEAELRIARDQADAANRAKTMFIANISHEIRTPMSAIIGFSDLLTDQAAPPGEHRMYTDTIRRNCRLLTQIIDDILDVAKAEAGKLDVTLENCPMNDFLSDVTHSLTPLAAINHTEVEIRRLGPLPETVATDPGRLKQILLNIVGNAVKFTGRGKVAVEVSAPAEGRLRFLVIDTGPGIAAEHQIALFKPFSQADASTRRRFGGTGLGLTLARELARALGGDVTLEASAPGRGSTFKVEIAAPPLDAKPAEAAAAGDRPKLTGMRVLVADDTADTRHLIAAVLSRAGAQVDVAVDGGEAVERAMAADYDAVLMDLQMPVRDGFQATAELRRLGYRKKVIAVSAAAMEEERRRSLAAGCDAHVAKPIDTRALFAALLN